MHVEARGVQGWGEARTAAGMGLLGDVDDEWVIPYSQWLGCMHARMMAGCTHACVMAGLHDVFMHA